MPKPVPWSMPVSVLPRGLVGHGEQVPAGKGRPRRPTETFIDAHSLHGSGLVVLARNRSDQIDSVSCERESCDPVNLVPTCGSEMNGENAAATRSGKLVEYRGREHRIPGRPGRMPKLDQHPLNKTLLPCKAKRRPSNSTSPNYPRIGARPSRRFARSCSRTSTRITRKESSTA